MNRRTATVLSTLLLSAGTICARPPVDTSWTYQGKLSSSGAPATGNYDLRFTLYSDAAGTTQVGSAQTISAVAVSSGLFTTKLDFGAQFTGSKRWLKVEVSPAGAGTYTALPLQEITSAPQSLFSELPWATSGTNISYAGGNVGIGTATPVSRLEIAAQDGLRISGFQPFLTLNDTNANLRSYIQGFAGDINFVPNSFQGQSAPVVIKNTTGNVGIGDQNPASRLSVFGNTSFNLVSTTISPTAGCNAVRAVVAAGASSNYSAAVAALNTVAPGAGQLNFGLYAQTVGAGQAVRGDAATGVGIVGTATSTQGYGGYFINTAPGGFAVWADGPMQCKSLKILGGADLAEPFDVASHDSGEVARPGMVVVIDENRTGELRLADQPYDGKVAGVISGANGLEPGMVMKAEGQADGKHPVAMTGRVWVYVDASFAPVRAGDLLTSSSTPGFAMKAADQSRAFGAVIGKAMSDLKDGKGLVLVLVNLQ